MCPFRAWLRGPKAKQFVDASRDPSQSRDRSDTVFGSDPRMSLADTKFVPEEKHWSAELQRKLRDATLDLVMDPPHGLGVLAGGIL